MKSQKEKNTKVRWLVYSALTAMVLIVAVVLFKNLEPYGNKVLPQEKAILNPDSLSASDSVAHAFNYEKNGRNFQLTFLEFGSKGCIECKKMEGVMDSVRSVYKDQVNVVFYAVRTNKKMTSHFGIQYIPVQILLNRQGKECFRHVGYYPFQELEKEIKKYGSI